jgi:hypothetical protein
VALEVGLEVDEISKTGRRDCCQGMHHCRTLSSEDVEHITHMQVCNTASADDSTWEVGLWEHALEASSRKVMTFISLFINFDVHGEIFLNRITQMESQLTFKNTHFKRR